MTGFTAGIMRGIWPRHKLAWFHSVSLGGGGGGEGGNTPVNHFKDCNGKNIFLSLLCTAMDRYFIGNPAKFILKWCALLKIVEMRIFLELL